MFGRLWTASTTMHAADQLTLAAAPLLAKAWGADTREIGLIVGAQSAAWLLLSLPAGILADRYARRTLMTTAALCALAGALIALIAVSVLQKPLLPLGAACFLISAGVVVIILSIFAILPAALNRDALPRANARMEFARAAVTMAMPVGIAWLISHQFLASVFVLCAALAIAALVSARGLPHDTPVQKKSPPVFAALRDGARFVLIHPTLRAIALCAIFWNLAFFALVSLFVPFASEILRYETQAIGRCWATFGCGMLLAAWFSPVITARVTRPIILVFGPGISMVAGLIFALANAGTPQFVVLAGFFMLGFGPMLWAVTQITLRQTITPPELMGRVGATIQVVNYGARPLGAVVAGWLAVQTSLSAAIWLPAVLFGLSFASMAVMVTAAHQAADATAQGGDAG